eukprot:gnl/MRDRNA2_/MRDRNA2_69874_c0_seq1.p1 gnl/MRDRNA2_/MRDRNA2_69874_c0~~gnl/MRDRNA2_/MRDRNA2_69874_c0_seq1.p1  ORF type:complete len:243 (+),score=30.13 gnl/MRDRNA2_/MRDRNA2_69874_c0_seq1:137-865(+)
MTEHMVTPPVDGQTAKNERPEKVLQVVIGTSKMASDDSTLVRRIAQFSHKSEGDVRNRLSMGDVGSDAANRVLHVAFLDDIAVGCCSSTTRWGGPGHGQWGALAVDPSAQKMGVASALVAAAEHRLLESGCTSVQIEYRYSPGNPHSERLRAWYEDKLGFSGSGVGFRFARKSLSKEQHRAIHTRRGQPEREPERYSLRTEDGEEELDRTREQQRGPERTREKSVSSRPQTSRVNWRCCSIM